MNFILLENGLKEPVIVRELDADIPIRINFEYSCEERLSDDWIYYAFESDGHLLEMKCGFPFGELLDLSFLAAKKITCADQELHLEVITIPLRAPILKHLNEQADSNKKYVKSMSGFKAYFFMNGIFLQMISEFSSIVYRFVRNGFSILTDEKFNIVGFIFDQFSEYEKESIITLSKFSEIIRLEKAPIYYDRNRYMNFENVLLKLILNLKNIDVWILFYTGINKHLINEGFIIKCAEAYLEREQTCSLAIEIAGLHAHETMKVTRLLEEDIRGKNYSDEFYNSVWFYLTSALQMHERRVVSS